MKPEHRTRYELDQEVVSAYAQTFLPRFDCYSVQMPDGSYRAVKHDLTLTIVEAHLRGHITIGAYMLTPENQTTKICLDADDDAEWHGLGRMADSLGTQHIPAYLEQSRRGGHLWLFFDPLSGTDARRFGIWLKQHYRLETVELYPKQAQLRTGPGSLVRLPLGIHQKAAPPKRYHFVNLDGTPLAPTVREQIAILAHPERVPKTFIQAAIKHIPKPKLFPPPSYKRSAEIAGDTPAERIKHAITVTDFVSQYVQLDRGGRGLCPFHDDHRESFSVDTERNYWQCFACNTGYTVIDFWMKWREIDFTEAIKELANEYLPLR